MRELHRKTFVSWDEIEDWKTKKTIRAIALCDRCDKHGYFYVAINAMRDGSMGEKDENGVYERKWWGDYIENSDVSDIRPATLSEVQLYLKYCPLEVEAKFNKEEIVAVIYGEHHTDVLVRPKKDSWWKRILNFFHKSDNLPL